VITIFHNRPNLLETKRKTVHSSVQFKFVSQRKVPDMPPVKVFKKTTPNERLTVYLGKRSFIDCIDFCEPITGVILVDDAYLKGRRVFGQLTLTYKYGHEADEVMGVKLSKDLTLSRSQFYPMGEHQRIEITPLQNNLLKKLGGNAVPFRCHFPVNAPNSVIIQEDANKKEDSKEKPLGVTYNLQVYVANGAQDEPHKRNMVEMEIIKLQYSAESRGERLPSSFVTKEFMFAQGKINVELTLNRELYYHGEEVPCTIGIGNNSSKTIRGLKCTIYQHIEYTMLNTGVKKKVTTLETRDGFPIPPGLFHNKTVLLLPILSNVKTRAGIAIDGFTSHDRNLHLASSTLTSDGKPVEAIGMVISYSVCVELDCGVFDRKLVNSVPLKLLNPAPGRVSNKWRK
jgi:arrestin-2